VVMKKPAVALLFLMLVAFAPKANASTIFILGTDAMGLHGDTSYINPIIDQMGDVGAGMEVLLYLTNVLSSVAYTAGNVTIDFKPYSFVTSSTILTSYSAIYVDSPGACCSDPGPLMDGGALGNISAFMGAGGNLGIGDYQGDSYWDSLLGFDGSLGVTVPGPTCVDPGISTPSGLAFGFDPSYSEGCFVHQEYDPAFWSGNGYFALQVAPSGNYVTMATGFDDPGNPVPEPASVGMLGFGLVAASVAVRRRRRTS
jgi:hypothetical protein